MPPNTLARHTRGLMRTGASLPAPNAPSYRETYRDMHRGKTHNTTEIQVQSGAGTYIYHAGGQHRGRDRERQTEATGLLQTMATPSATRECLRPRCHTANGRRAPTYEHLCRPTREQAQTQHTGLNSNSDNANTTLTSTRNYSSENRVSRNS